MGDGYIGKLARSKAGHDSGKIYVIIAENSAYVYLVDGRIRTLSRPKKKKKKPAERRTSQMADNFYANWFSRTQPPRPTPEQMWERETAQLRNFATSETAQQLIERFDVPEVEEAEELFKKALQEIADPETRNRLDMAAGQISRAYQILGFCAGRFSQDSRARIF